MDLRKIKCTLQNPALRLEWIDGVLHAHNLATGNAIIIDSPGFAIEISGNRLADTDFSLTAFASTSTDATFSFTCPTTALTATVRYWLDGDYSWFRKQVTFTAPQNTPTPARVWVHTQSEVPSPVRRVGYGLRGGLDAEQQEGRDTYANQPGCGFPVYSGDWFFGIEHPSAFTVPGETIEIYHHPVWDADGSIISFPTVFGCAASREAVPDLFMDYLWTIRYPRLSKPFIIVSDAWSTIIGGDKYEEYQHSWEAADAFLDAMEEIGLKPDGLGMDAGYFDRASFYQGMENDQNDEHLIAMRKRVEALGMKLSLWVSHNGPVGLDPNWIRQQGWEIGDGPGDAYSNNDYVVMMQPSFEKKLGDRFVELVRNVGVSHLKIDWDNECATNPAFDELYPTPDHVREASLLAFNRIDKRMREANPDLITRNGWWPSPWWLTAANHVWLTDSGDLEYAALPSRTQRDRDNTHRDAMYFQMARRSETPMPFDAWDNHGFGDAMNNPCANDHNTWLDNLILQFMRGTTYLHMPFTPEGLRQWQVNDIQATLAWFHYHADELGTRHTRMVGGDPAAGEVYGYLHPSEDAAWLVLRNPSVAPKRIQTDFKAWLGYHPNTIRQVYPFWQDLRITSMELLGHEVVVLKLFRHQQPEVTPAKSSPFMVAPYGDSWVYSFPGSVPTTDKIGPTVAPAMQIHSLGAEKTADEATDNGWRLQWYLGVPYRMEKAEILISVSAPEDILDDLVVRASTARFRAGAERNVMPVTRIYRKEQRGHGTSRILPPLGPRDRDYYVFTLPDGGYTSATIDFHSDRADELILDAWVTGYDAPARQAARIAQPPMDGPLLPSHPYGFSRWMKIR